MRPCAIARILRRVLASVAGDHARAPKRTHRRPPLRLALEELETRLTPSGALVVAPGLQVVAQDAPVVFAANNGTAITVGDSAAGNGQDTVYVQVLGGTVTAANTGALGAISGNGSSLVALTGTLPALNSALGGLTYVPPTHFAGSTLLSVLIAPANGPNASAFVPLDFVSAPIIGVPAGQTTGIVNGFLTFSASSGNAISVADPNLSGGTDTVWLEAGVGTFAITSFAGMNVSGLGTSFIECTGTLAQINAALDGLIYIAPASFSGQDLLSITVNDYGTLPPVSAAATLTLTTPGFAPTVSAQANLTINRLGMNFSTANGTAISVADGHPNSSGDGTIIQVMGGTLTVPNVNGVFVSGNGTALIGLTGGIAALNAVLDGLHYTPAANGAPDYLSVLLGNGVHFGTAGVALTFENSTTLAPILTVPGIQDASFGDVFFSAAAGNAIHVAAGDANGAIDSVIVQATSGPLTVSNTAGLASITGNDTSYVTMTGTLGALNQALDGLKYVDNNTSYSAPLFANFDYLDIAVGNNGSQGGPARYTFASVEIVSAYIVDHGPNSGPGDE